MRRLFVSLILLSGMVLGLPQLATAANVQVSPAPTAVWGSILQAAQTPQGAMAWDGQHLWANTGTTATEVWADSFSNGHAKSRTVNLMAHDFNTPWGSPSTMVMLDGHLFMTGMLASVGHAGVAEIDPFGTPPQVLATYDLQILGGVSMGGVILQGGVAQGSSIILASSLGSLWRFTPSTHSMTEITGLAGIPSSLAFAGDRLWVGYLTGPTPIAAYGFSSTTTALGAPVASVSSPVTAVTALSADANFLWALQGGTVTKVSLADGSVVTSGIPAGSGPTGIASAGTWVWVADPSASPAALIGINAANPSASTTIALVPPAPTSGGAISGVLFDGTDLWSAEVTDGTIEQLKLYPSAPVVSAISETGTGAVHFTFTPPSSTGNTATLTYELQIDGPTKAGIMATPPIPTGIDVSGLEPGGHYCFTIAASNGPFRQLSAPSCITLTGTATTTTQGGGLAATGAPVGLIALGGLALCGLGIVLITRRRRVI